MAIKNINEPLIRIPSRLRIRVDDVVKSGLYSSEMEFVNDAVRRLILQSKKEEIMLKDCKNAIAEDYSMEDGKLGFTKRPPP